MCYGPSSPSILVLKFGKGNDLVNGCQLRLNLMETVKRRNDLFVPQHECIGRCTQKHQQRGEKVQETSSHPPKLQSHRQVLDSDDEAWIHRGIRVRR